MRKAFFLFLFTALIPLCADIQPIEPYTAKVIGSKVRLRSSPDLEGSVVREFASDDLVVVAGEVNGFYAVNPPKDIKVYVYRNFIYDSVVDGAHVNVRLAPDTEAPIVAQLNTGDKVQGEPYSQNPKWIEITPPSQAKFYVSKELLEKVGGPEIYATHEKRSGEVARFLNSAYIVSLAELRKPFAEIRMDQVAQGFEKVIKEYDDFPNYSQQAAKVLAMAQDLYLQKKLVFLEEKTQLYPADSSQITAEFEQYHRTVYGLREELAKNHVAIALETFQDDPSNQALDLMTLAHRVMAADNECDEVHPQVGEIGTVEAPTAASSMVRSAFVTDKMRAWQPVEESLYQAWAIEKSEGSLDQFYADEALEARFMNGLLETYNRPIANRPGDYVLKVDNRPVAFLYSTRVNLENYIGQQVKLKVVARPNHNFAFPAYYVIGVE